MCEVTTIALVGAAVIGAYSAYSTSSASKKAQQQQAAIDDNNAIAAEMQRSDALNRGQQDEAMHRLQVGQLMARQTTQLAANGVVTTDGSALGLLADTQLMGNFDAATIRGNSQREAWGFGEQARQLREGAGQRRWAAGRINPGLSAGASLAGSAAQYAGYYYPATQRAG